MEDSPEGDGEKKPDHVFPSVMKLREICVALPEKATYCTLIIKHDI